MLDITLHLLELLLVLLHPQAVSLRAKEHQAMSHVLRIHTQQRELANVKPVLAASPLQLDQAFVPEMIALVDLIRLPVHLLAVVAVSSHHSRDLRTARPVIPVLEAMPCSLPIGVVVSSALLELSAPSPRPHVTLVHRIKSQSLDPFLAPLALVVPRPTPTNRHAPLSLPPRPLPV